MGDLYLAVILIDSFSGYATLEYHLHECQNEAFDLKQCPTIWQRQLAPHPPEQLEQPDRHPVWD